MRELVNLRTRPSRDGRRFTYRLDYIDENGKRRRISLGHCDRRKAERQRCETERELISGVLGPPMLRLSQFFKDSIIRTGSQIRESTACERKIAMKQFIKITGDISYQDVTFRHGEAFRQACFDAGNSPATVSKKLRQLKRVFQLAVNRRQLSENPFRALDLPKVPRRKVNTYSYEECERILAAAKDHTAAPGLNWELLILMALATGLRRGELLNCTWADIDFEKMTVSVLPKSDSKETWQWEIKDADNRTLPLTDDIVSMLVVHQEKQPEGLPYIFIPPDRYSWIQQLRKEGKWTFSDSRLKVVNNFTREFKRILNRAGLDTGQFHDLRRTAMTNWLSKGMSKEDLMPLAGHADFKTTMWFYLAVSRDLVDRARQATRKSLAHFWHAPCNLDEKV